MPPRTSEEFDRVYLAPLTPWGDLRIPRELSALVGSAPPRRVLELGCGVGRFSRYAANQGHRVTGVDFSAVAIGKAQARVAHDAERPEFVVGDVTDLRELRGHYDVGFDVGCFHCLDAEGRARYAAEVHRLLEPGGTHLIWAIDGSPSGDHLSPASIEEELGPHLRLRRVQASRRRLARSHWYWLEREPVAFAST